MKGSITTTRVVGTLLVLTMILALVVAPGRSPVTAEAGGGAVVDLVLLPQTQTVNVGDEFDITIEARCHGQKIHGVDVFLDFDPTYLEVVSITCGDTLDVPLLSDWDNAAGTVDYSAGKLLPPFPDHTFDVAVVTLRAKAATDSTSISFHHVSPRQTLAVFEGESVLRETIGATVTITAVVVPPRYTLTVTVDPEGSGTVSLSPEPDPVDGKYAAQTEVTLTAEPAAGYTFSHWSGHATGTDPVTTVTMDADKTVTAHFTAVVVL
ncbi:cohesin domain-containing protein, partial [Dehalococcoidia bacterium]|nr:cohesin domain-containing protein [Dehalococcoidia bacterium]